MAQDQKLIEILTGTAPDCGTTARWDFSCTRVVCNKSKTERKGGGQQGGGGGARPDFWWIYAKMYIKMSFFNVTSEVQKGSEDVCAGIIRILSGFDIKVGEVNFELDQYN